MGTTASGKSDVAEALADRIGAQLINADAFQVYRGMDIGTAKSPRKSAYALMDICDPRVQFGLGEYVSRAMPLLSNLFEEGRSAIVVGGSGLYIRALFDGYAEMYPEPDPELRLSLNDLFAREGLDPILKILQARDPAIFQKIDRQNPRRVIRAIEKTYAIQPVLNLQLPDFIKKKFWVDRSPEIIAKRINDRFEDMIAQGWLIEVKNLLDTGYTSSLPGFKAHGYRWICQYLCGQMELADVRARTVQETVQYAKRQRTWLRKEVDLIPLEHDGNENLVSQIMRHLQSNEDHY